MAADPGFPFRDLLPLAFCLAGFHGVFFYSSLWKKAASWCAFQAGLGLFLFLSAPPGNALSHALEILITAVTLAVWFFLSFFCATGEGRLKPAESGKKFRPTSPSPFVKATGDRRLRGTGRIKFFNFKGKDS